MKNTLRRKLNSNRGVTLIELVTAGTIAGIGILACSSVFSYVSAANATIDKNQALQSVVTGTFNALGASMKQNWLNLAGQGCSASKASYTMAGFSGLPYGAVLLNQTQLKTLIPAGNPLYSAVSSLISSYGANASAKCTDSATLSQTAYSVIGKSPYNQKLCRCATSVTPYGTFQAAESDALLSAQAGFYSCAAITLNSGHSSAQASPFLSSGTVIVESVYSITTGGAASPQNCSAIGSSMPANSQGTLNFNYTWSSSSASSTTLSQAGTLVIQ